MDTLQNSAHKKGKERVQGKGYKGKGLNELGAGAGTVNLGEKRKALVRLNPKASNKVMTIGLMSGCRTGTYAHWTWPQS